MFVRTCGGNSIGFSVGGIRGGNIFDAERNAIVDVSLFKRLPFLGVGSSPLIVSIDSTLGDFTRGRRMGMVLSGNRKLGIGRRVGKGGGVLSARAVFGSFGPKVAGSVLRAM